LIPEDIISSLESSLTTLRRLKYNVFTLYFEHFNRDVAFTNVNVPNDLTLCICCLVVCCFYMYILLNGVYLPSFSMYLLFGRVLFSYVYSPYRVYLPSFSMYLLFGRVLFSYVYSPYWCIFAFF